MTLSAPAARGGLDHASEQRPPEDAVSALRTGRRGTVPHIVVRDEAEFTRLSDFLLSDDGYAAASALGSFTLTVEAPGLTPRVHALHQAIVTRRNARAGIRHVLGRPDDRHPPEDESTENLSARIDANIDIVQASLEAGRTAVIRMGIDTLEPRHVLRILRLRAAHGDRLELDKTVRRAIVDMFFTPPSAEVPGLVISDQLAVRRLLVGLGVAVAPAGEAIAPADMPECEGIIAAIGVHDPRAARTAPAENAPVRIAIDGDEALAAMEAALAAGRRCEITMDEKTRLTAAQFRTVLRLCVVHKGLVMMDETTRQAVHAQRRGVRFEGFEFEEAEKQGEAGELKRNKEKAVLFLLRYAGLTGKDFKHAPRADSLATLLASITERAPEPQPDPALEALDALARPVTVAEPARPPRPLPQRPQLVIDDAMPQPSSAEAALASLGLQQNVPPAPQPARDDPFAHLGLDAPATITTPAPATPVRQGLWSRMTSWLSRLRKSSPAA